MEPHSPNISSKTLARSRSRGTSIPKFGTIRQASPAACAMPLLDGQAHQPEAPPGGALFGAPVWVIRFTGEIFCDFG